MPIQAPGITERADYYDLERAALQGYMLPEVSATALEEALIYNPEDLITRARLLGYYSIKKTRSAKLRNAINEARVKHVIWFIEHAPDCIFAGDKYLNASKITDREHYSKILSVWSDAVQDNPQPQTRINFALFLSEHDKDRAITILKQLQRDVPSNPWPASILSVIDPRFKAPIVQKNAIPFSVDEQLKDNAMTTRIFHTARMPNESVELLRKVLADQPYDLPVRTGLIGQLSNRAKRANLLGYDPAIVKELIEQLHFLVACSPRSNFWSDLHGQMYENLPAHELSQLRDAWLEQLKRNPNDAGIAAAATCFFWYAKERALSNHYFKLAKRLSKNDQDAQQLLTYGLPYRRESRTPIWAKDLIGLLDTVACTSSKQVTNSAPGPYTFQEWARDLALDSAELTGVYQWVPLSSSQALERAMPEASPDCVNRALIVGCYSSEMGLYNQGKAHIPLDQAWQGYERQIRWFIDNLPQSRLLSVCKYGMESMRSERPELFHRIKQRLNLELSKRSPDIDALITFALLFSKFDKAETARINERIKPLNLAWYERFRKICGTTDQPLNIAAVLESHNFTAGRRSARLSRAAQKLDLTAQYLHGKHLPFRTIWSNEFALAANPNDLVLRAELMGAYDNFDQFKICFGGHTPDVLEPLIRHNLWWIENIPDFYLYGTSCDLSGDTPRCPDLREHAILLKAAVMQLHAYKDNLKVHLALDHYFPLGCEKESLKHLREIRKRHPNNRTLADRIEHRKALMRNRPSFS